MALSAFEKMTVAKSKERPNFHDYTSMVFSEFTELHGDRLYGDDPAISGGIAYFEGRPVTVIGHVKGKNVNENITCNFGMPQPEGYRKALRLLKQAEKFGRPGIMIVDTPGAHCGVEAEARGQGAAIAQNLMDIMGLRIPILTVVTGEGGSGGALALAVSNEVHMLENATYSVISPKGCASILYKDPSREKEACENLKLTAQDLLELGVSDGIVPEPQGGAQADYPFIAREMRKLISGFLSRYRDVTPDECALRRYERFRGIGKYIELNEMGGLNENI